MLWIIFALGAALAWGLYGPALHRGQVALAVQCAHCSASGLLTF